MAKKIGIGCLAVFALLVVGGGAFLYTTVLRPARDVVTAARSVGQIQQLNEGVRNRSTFEAPANGLLEQASVERYLSVQQRIEDALSGRLEQLETKYAEFESSDRDPNLSELASAWADVMNLIVEAKEAQVEALNELNFSLDEYSWTRSRVLQAAGYGAYGYDLAAVLGGQEQQQGTSSTTAPVPAANIQLVEPHLAQMEKFLPLAYFGL